MSIRLAPKLGKRILSVGCVFLVAGLVGLWFTVEAAGTAVSSYQMIPALAVCGLGLGLVVAPLINIILAGIHAGSAGSASGVLTTVQQVGGALGVAIIGIIFFGQVSGYAPVVAQSSAQTVSAQLAAAGLPRRRGRRRDEHIQPLLRGPVSELGPVDARHRDARTSPPSASCAAPSPASPARVRCVVAPIAAQAVAQDFDHAFRDGLFFEMACFGLVFLMVFVLPRPQNLYGPPGAGGGGH